jgi:hypothetical protein
MIDPYYAAFMPRRNRRWKELRAQAEAARVEQPVITQTAVISASTFTPEPETPLIPVKPEPKRSVKEVISDLVGNGKA